MTRNYQIKCSTLGWDGQDRSSSLRLGDDPVRFDQAVTLVGSISKGSAPAVQVWEPSDSGQSLYSLLCREQASLPGFPESRLTNKARPTLLGQRAASTATGFLVISNKSLGLVLAAHLQGSAAGAEALVILVLLVFSHPLF